MPIEFDMRVHLRDASNGFEHAHIVPTQTQLGYIDRKLYRVRSNWVKQNTIDCDINHVVLSIESKMVESIKPKIACKMIYKPTNSSSLSYVAII